MNKLNMKITKLYGSSKNNLTPRDIRCQVVIILLLMHNHIGIILPTPSTLPLYPSSGYAFYQVSLEENEPYKYRYQGDDGHDEHSTPVAGSA